MGKTARQLSASADGKSRDFSAGQSNVSHVYTAAAICTVNPAQSGFQCHILETNCLRFRAGRGAEIVVESCDRAVERTRTAVFLASVEAVRAPLPSRLLSLEDAKPSPKESMQAVGAR